MQNDKLYQHDSNTRSEGGLVPSESFQIQEFHSSDKQPPSLSLLKSLGRSCTCRN
jgi:hypothetical protein